MLNRYPTKKVKLKGSNSCPTKMSRALRVILVISLFPFLHSFHVTAPFGTHRLGTRHAAISLRAASFDQEVSTIKQLKISEIKVCGEGCRQVCVLRTRYAVCTLLDRFAVGERLMSSFSGRAGSAGSGTQGSAGEE